MFRKSAPEDRAGILKVASECKLFENAELSVLEGMLDKYLKGRTEREEIWFSQLAEDGRVVAVAYCAEELMTDRVWNLLFIAVLPTHQDQGVGARVLGSVLEALKERTCRMVIVETAGIDKFESARRFYERHGFDQEGSIRDFYADSVDKVVYRKLL